MDNLPRKSPESLVLSRAFRKIIPVALLGLPLLACSNMNTIASLQADPLTAAAMGVMGMLALEAELCISAKIRLNLANNNALQLILKAIAVGAVPTAVGILSSLAPGIGYAAFAMPIVVGVIHLSTKSSPKDPS